MNYTIKQIKLVCTTLSYVIRNKNVICIKKGNFK